MYKTLYLLIDEQTSRLEIVEKLSTEIASRTSLAVVPHLSTLPLPSAEDALFLLYLDDNATKAFFATHYMTSLDVALLPHPQAPIMQKRYGIQKNIADALTDALDETLRTQDEKLLCNGTPVYKRLSLGNVQNLHRTSTLTLWQALNNFIANLHDLHYQVFTLQTAKERVIQTAASGMLILEDYTFHATLKLNPNNTYHDGKLNAFVIAPLSLVSYLYHLIVIFLYHHFGIGSLPQNIGFLSTSSLRIESPKPIEFLLDDVKLCADVLELNIVSTPLRVHFGTSYREQIAQKNDTANANETETIKIVHLPKGEIQNLLIEGNIPLFKRASDEDMKDTLIAIKEASKPTAIFITLMVLSTMLATTGIFQNSIATVIGAMILAPLMSPIIALSMGIVRNEGTIINSSITTLAVGIGSALLFSSFMALTMPLEIHTDQITSRLNPNLLDLIVAILSGMAGAYAHAKEEVAKSLAGVAIAVALVPPLAVTGVGIGWMDWEVIYGSFLLFLTNLFGVTLAASITFIVLGFAPIHKAKKGIAYSGVLLLLISIPLVISFYSLVLQSNDYVKLSHLPPLHIDGKEITLNNIIVKSSSSDAVTLELEVISASQLLNGEFQHIKTLLERELGKRVTMHVVPKLVVR
ncbi:MAG: hypothetical protein KU37_08485 [Sulfuricurvum sp. PC08-66]|nr:MAG: hypothetical protein KU37_08485 [Sulfuricurvum sp. PC08-66]